MSSFAAVVAHISIDWAIVAVLIVVLTADAMRSGISRSVGVLLGSLAVLTFAQLLPHAVLIGPATSALKSPLMPAVIFLALYAVAIVLSHRIFGSYSGYGLNFPHSLMTACATTIAIITVWINSGVLQNIWHFGPQITTLFGAAYALWWLIGSMIVIAFVRG